MTNIIAKLFKAQKHRCVPPDVTYKNLHFFHCSNWIFVIRHRPFFYVLLTVHPGSILVNNQSDAQLLSCTFIPILYMFRTLLCSSSVKSTVLIWYPVYVTLRRWPSIVQVWMELSSSIQTCTLDGHLLRVTYTRCRINTTDSPDDEHRSVRNMQRIGINVHERSCASGWLFTRNEYPFYSLDNLCLSYILTQRLYRKKNFTDNKHKQQVTGSNKCHRIRIMKHSVLYFPRNIMTDIKSRMKGNIASTRETTKWNNSPWKSLTGRGHFENKGLKDMTVSQ